MPNWTRVVSYKPNESASLHKLENIQDAENVFIEPV